jgi:hypothetical protein
MVCGRNAVKMFRLYTGPDSTTHFEDVDVGFRDDGEMGELAELLSGLRGRVYLRRGVAFMPDFHVSHERMYMVLQEGVIDMISSNGSRRSISPGDVVLLEDLEGNGHIFRFNSGSRWAAFFVSMEP